MGLSPGMEGTMQRPDRRDPAILLYHGVTPYRKIYRITPC